MDNDNTTSNSTFNSSSSNTTFEDWQSQQAPKSFWTNLTLPVLYLSILIGSLYAFSTLYRKRQQARAAKLEPWFGRHKSRDVYLSLLQLDPADAPPSDGNSEKKPLKQVPDSVLKSALLLRAVEDIRRIMALRGSKQACQTLLQRGSVGEDVWQRFLRAEQEIEEEVKDVVSEANAFTPGWGQIIFQSANEMLQNNLLRERTTELQGQLEDEKAWWEQKRSGIKSQLMKEIGEEETETDADTDEQTILTPPAGSNTSSDDAVLVDEGGPAAGSQGGGSKKSKGKK